MTPACARKSYLIPPVSDTQTAFYRIRTAHEEGKSEAVLRESDVFLGNCPPEELARAVRYYRAAELERMGKNGEARKEFRWIAEHYPESDWAALAQSHLRSLGNE